MPDNEPYVECCPKCGTPSASPPAEVYCVDCATAGWERDAIEHLRVRAEHTEAEVDRLRAAMSQALVVLRARQMVTAEQVLREALDAR